MRKMSLHVCVHNPVLRSVKLYQEDGLWIIRLGDEALDNVTMFASDDEWDTLVATVNGERRRIRDNLTDADVAR